MKTLARYIALAALAAILGSCSFAVGALNHKKSRVVASAIWRGSSAASATRTVRSAIAARTLSPLVAKRRALPTRPASAVVRSSRSVAPGASKDLSASTDIDFITYEIANLDPNSGESAIQDYLDPNYPYIDIFLTPGQNYRITVDVTLLPTSPAATAGALVGIGAYGDSADIAVPADGSDVWVDLTIHAMGILIKNQVSGTAVTFVNPTTGALGAGSVSPSVTTKAQDRFFYTSDSLLYYFNYTLNSVYEWTDISTTLVTASAPSFGGSIAAGGPGIQIYAICPDPAYAGWFYVVGQNQSSGLWELDVVNYDPFGVVGPTAAAWNPVPGAITTDLGLGRLSPTVIVTGVTADPYGFAYVTFYNTVASGPPVSGMVEYDSYYGGLPIAQYIPDTTLGWTSANSIFTDVIYGGSNLYLLGSPNTTTAGLPNNTGTADVFIFDTYFNQLSTNPSPVAQSYNGSVPSPTGGGSLIKPNKFVGMIQGGTFFVSQTDFVTGGAESLSAVSLDLSSMRSAP
jgi:hypothetical protein